MKLLTVLLFMTFLQSCGSGKLVKTKDICKINKHYKDSVFQIQINGEEISQRWYTYDEAVSITKLLVKDNKCMR